MSRQFILFKDTLSIDIGGTLAKVVLFQPRRGGEMPTEIRDLDAALDDGTLAVAPFAGEACPFFFENRSRTPVCAYMSHAHSTQLFLCVTRPFTRYISTSSISNLFAASNLSVHVPSLGVS